MFCVLSDFCCPPHQVSLAVRRLSAFKEVRSTEELESVSTISCCSCSLGDTLADESASRKQRQGRLKRQLPYYTADLIFLQSSSHQNSLASPDVLNALHEQGYEHISGLVDITLERLTAFFTTKVGWRNFDTRSCDFQFVSVLG